MTNEQIRAACEAILFASGEPVELSRMAQALELERMLFRVLFGSFQEALTKEAAEYVCSGSAVNISFVPVLNMHSTSETFLI